MSSSSNFVRLWNNLTFTANVTTKHFFYDIQPTSKFLTNYKMAIHIESGKNNLDLGADRTSKVQLMPFRIKADCEAKVSQFFEPCVTLDQRSGCCKGSFRGYPLVGEKIELPEGYLGVILDEKIKPATDKEDRRFFVRGNFKSMLYWNWDKTPSKNDALVKTLSDWIDVAEALHSPIIEE